MEESPLFYDQLLATKFFIPASSHGLIPRPRLNALLTEGLQRRLTLVSAPAGYGKTTLLSAWLQSLAENNPRVAWLSLDEGDNEPRLFWSYVLTALDRRQPGLCAELLTYLQAQQAPPLRSMLQAFINTLLEQDERFLLILDDYHQITEQAVHDSLAYLIGHVPPQLHIILATRADPPLPIALLRARGDVLEVYADHLRCTPEEVKAFLREVMSIELSDDVIQKVADRTEGWLVGLQLLGLSLQGRIDSASLLDELHGSQRYILDYLIEEVLRRQPAAMQTFLLHTSILERLSASLCDAVGGQSDSQQFLEQLERANLFVVALDGQRKWYRYHALFAEALRYRLAQTRSDLVPTLHHSASVWYAEHGHITEAVLHAFRACEWPWAAELIERIPYSIIWGAEEQQMFMLRNFLEQLPSEVIHARPRLCLACAQMMYTVAPPALLETWLYSAETTLAASLAGQAREGVSEALQKQQNLLGEVIAFRAYLRSYQEDGRAALALCQQALALLSEQNLSVRAQVAFAQALTCFHSSANDAVAASQNALQAGTLAQNAGNVSLATFYLGIAAYYQVKRGLLHEARALTQRAIQLRTRPGTLQLPEVGWPYIIEADILREWNQLDAALDCARQALSFGKQTESLYFSLLGYAVLLRVYLSRAELDAAHAAWQQFEHIGMNVNPHLLARMRSHYTTTDQVRLWLARGELDQASRWAAELDVGERLGAPFAREQEEVARARILLAQRQPALALERLEPLLTRAAAAERWNDVLAMRLLQALAYQMRHEDSRAIVALSQAARLGEPDGYIRSFVDEGPTIAALLSRLREQERKKGATPYLDTLLSAFSPENAPHKSHQAASQPGKRVPEPPLLDPLSDREVEVLHLIAQGNSNPEIADRLVLSLDTIKSHAYHIFSKLGVKNRVQAVARARALGILSDDR